MLVTDAAIAAVKIVLPTVLSDPRGTFCETFNRQRYAEHGIGLEFVQDNISSSVEAYTVRGLHFQRPPMAQHKLVQVIRGRILDIAVDLRRSSPTYGHWVAEELSDIDRKQLLVPIGFAHGFCTLVPDTHVMYKATAHYSPAHDLGVAWDDPDLEIDWKVKKGDATISERDKGLPSFRSLEPFFE